MIQTWKFMYLTWGMNLGWLELLLWRESTSDPFKASKTSIWHRFLVIQSTTLQLYKDEGLGDVGLVINSTRFGFQISKNGPHVAQTLRQEKWNMCPINCKWPKCPWWSKLHKIFVLALNSIMLAPIRLYRYVLSKYVKKFGKHESTTYEHVKFCLAYSGHFCHFNKFWKNVML